MSVAGIVLYLSKDISKTHQHKPLNQTTVMIKKKKKNSILTSLYSRLYMCLPFASLFYKQHLFEQGLCECSKQSV